MGTPDTVLNSIERISIIHRSSRQSNSGDQFVLVNENERERERVGEDSNEIKMKTIINIHIPTKR